MEQDYETIDLRELFLALKHNAILIIASTLICAITGLLVTVYLIAPQYEASATMIVNTRQDVTTTITNDQITSAKSLVATYSIIVRSDRVLVPVIQALGLDEDYEELARRVVVAPVDETQVMRISIKDSDPQRAKAIVKEITVLVPDVITEMVEAGSVKVISESRVTEYPVSPSKRKNTAIAGMLGLVLSAGFVILRDMMNTTLKTSEEVQEKIGLTVLGVIPDID